MKKAIILLPLILLGLSANAQGVVDQKGSKRVADSTNDSWKNDVPNTQVSLTYRSDNTTARTAGTEFVIKDNGNVGIGTASPGGRLQVTNGDLRLENQNNWNAYKGVTFSNTQYPQLFLFQARGTKASPTYPQSGTTLGVFRSANAIDSTGGAGFKVRSTEQQSAAAHGTSLIIFTNKNGETDNTDQFIVDQSGNVGVGDMAPAQKLTVRGVNAQPTATVSAQTNATLRVSGNTNHNLDFGTYANSPYGAYIQSHDNTTANGLPLVFNPTGGNVGISTDNPQSKLHVNGALQVTGEINVGGTASTAGSAGTAGQILTSNGAGTAPSWKTGSAVAGDIKQSVLTADHDGWIKLDGRLRSTLTAAQQTQATTLFGAGTNLPDASNAFLVQNGGTPGAVSGSNSRTVARNQLPNTTLSLTGTAASAGDHTHSYVDRGNTTFNVGTTGGPTPVADDTNGNYTTGSAGAHTHSVTGTTESLNGAVTQQALDITPRSFSVNTFVYLGQ